MLKPHYLQQIADGAEQIASELHEYIIRQIMDRMMLRIGRGEDYLFTSSDRWRIQILQDAGYLLEGITAELSKYTRLQEKEIREAMEDAGVKALEYDDNIYKAVGLSPVPLWESPALVRLMERNYLATLGEWNNYTKSTVEATQRLFLKECDIAYNKVMSGAVSYNQAVKEAIEAVVSNGVYVEYPSGHRDTIETATARAVRTGIAQAAGDISLKRMEEMDWDIILVSAHIGARTGDGGQNPGNHLWWQGQFYSRTGKDRRFPPFSQTGYGTGEGLCGWNCRHSFGSGDGINNPYADIQTEDNIRLEKLEQRQRALERRIRKTKREVMGLRESVHKCQDEVTKNELQQTLDRKSYTLQRQNKAYRDFCKDNDLRQLPERIQIAKRRMEQAAKARRQSKPEKSVAKASSSDIIRLPRYQEVVIPKEKLTEYALNPLKDANKSEAFRKALGYTLENAGDLIEQINERLPDYNAVEKGDRGWGMTYEVVMDITGPNGKTAKVLTAWIDDKKNGEMRMTTVHVDS